MRSLPERLSGCDSPLWAGGPAPPPDDIRGMEIAAALKPPVMGARWKLCDPGRPPQPEGGGWEGGGDNEVKREQQVGGDANAEKVRNALNVNQVWLYLT